ncbi:MAG: type II toxin-antitoxin system prevent-host-death family antitoxin [Patescibacteria group bacterium]|nr:type II toxin-antitoxin system prevent-host-death family antitoxin [Patescibacteria group bacterium]
MEKIIGLKELRERMGHYTTEVEKGKSFLIVRKSRPVFRIAPVEEESAWEPVVDFTKVKNGGVSARDILKALRK